ncbi:low temperature-responsive protein [Cryptococcus deuterogattii MMRL2647]|nr:low temperature-responsive protein [Cryptococcus deuterogattii MMRL2647]
MSYRIGVILGSTRRLSNTLGFSNYLAFLVSAHFPSLTLETVHLATSPGHPLPLLLEDIPPAGHPKDTLPDAYEDESVRKWSATVLGWDGAIVDLPVGLITLGGHGGSKVHDQLKTICGGGLDMKVVGNGVEVNIPKELIRGKDRTHGDEAWLKEYDGRVKEIIRDLMVLVEKRRGERDGDVVAAQVTA